MDIKDRNTIQRNHVKLSQTVDLDLLYPVLLKKEIIFRGDLDRLKAKFLVKDEQAQEFFLRYTRRGPNAFKTLIESLIETGHITEAKLLQDNAEGGYDGDLSRRSSSGVEPFPASVSAPSRSSPLSENASPKLSARYTPEMMMEELPQLTLQVQNAVIYNNGVSVDECYQMMSNPRGFALIINNLEFASDPNAKRYGAEQDSDNLEKVFRLLHFNVTVRHNVQKVALLKEGGIIDTFLAQFDSTDVDCCMVAVMSHGTDGYFLTSDPEMRDPSSNRVSLSREFLPRFNNHYPPLQNKPKIFIIQACRGELRDRGVILRTVVDSKDPEKSGGSGSEESSPSLSYRSNKSSASSSSDLDRMPSFEDFLICQSTVPGFVANRDTERGTWYIYTLCQELCERAHDTEFTAILKRVSRKMRRLSSEFGEKQMSSFINTGFHFDLYFNPGLFKS